MFGFVGKRERTAADFCERPLLKKILLFSIPLMITGVLQIFYNTADLMVVGRFRGEAASAAVSSSGPLASLFTHLFIGMSTGTNAILGKYIGAKRDDDVRRVAHTALPVGLLCGLLVAAAGILTVPLCLRAMGTPDEVMPLSTLYLRIYFAGAPFSLVYNFGAALFRAAGDSKRPMYIMTGAGLINLVLNLLFVGAFGMGVEGVAIATVISQILSAVVAVAMLMRRKDICRIEPKRLRLSGKAVKEILLVGVPTGVSGMFCDFANTMIQTAVNGFGTNAMAGYGAAMSIINFTFTCMYSLAQACMTFTAQNYGAGKYRNFLPIIGDCFLIITVISLIASAIVLPTASSLLGLFNDEPECIEYGRMILFALVPVHFFNGYCDTLNGALRGTNKPMVATLIMILAYVFPVYLWTHVVFAVWHSFVTLAMCVPVLLVFVTSVLAVAFFIRRRNLMRAAREAVPAEAAAEAEAASAKDDPAENDPQA